MTLAEMERLKVPAKNRGRDRPQPQLSKRPKLEPKVRERWHLSHRERALADEIRFSCSLREVRGGKEPLYPPQHVTVKSSPRDQKSHNVPVASSQTAYIEPHIFCLYKCLQSGDDDCNSN